MSSDSRKRQILDAAKQCFAQYGYAATTTKRVAAAASISEGLLFRHFATKAALHSAILDEACETDPDLNRLLKLEPSTETLVTLVSEMIRHFVAMKTLSNAEKAEKVRLTTSSLLEDGEFAGLLFEKIGGLIGPLFEESLREAVEAGDAVRVGAEPVQLFWFTHHVLHTLALTRLPEKSALLYPGDDALSRQLSDFILRGVGLTPSAIAHYLDRKTDFEKVHDLVSESA